MAANAAAFSKAIGLTQVDVLGFSLGGPVAQERTLAEPELVCRRCYWAPAHAAAKAWPHSRLTNSIISDADLAAGIDWILALSQS
jgi:pimeloyl-ACP methyl ester carboxylesterase